MKIVRKISPTEQEELDMKVAIALLVSFIVIISFAAFVGFGFITQPMIATFLFGCIVLLVLYIFVVKPIQCIFIYFFKVEW